MTLPPNEGLPHRVRAPALISILATVSVATLDISITSTALPTIAQNIGTSGASSIWAVNAYHLVVVAAPCRSRRWAGLLGTGAFSSLD